MRSAPRSSMAPAGRFSARLHRVKCRLPLLPALSLLHRLFGAPLGLALSGVLQMNGLVPYAGVPLASLPQHGVVRRQHALWLGESLQPRQMLREEREPLIERLDVLDVVDLGLDLRHAALRLVEHRTPRLLTPPLRLHLALANLSRRTLARKALLLAPPLRLGRGALRRCLDGDWWRWCWHWRSSWRWNRRGRLCGRPL